MAECAVYGGIAAGGGAAGWSGMWQLATMAVIVVALRDAFTACAGRQQAVRQLWTRRLVLTLANPPAMVRVLIAAVALMVHGPRVSIFSVLALETLSLLFALARLRRRKGRAARRREPVAPGLLLTARDDGALVRWAGRLVQGNLLPLPPAVAGLAATALLAVLGMGNLHGVIALTPPVVMLLAAVGSSHPHTGRFDWLVPVSLLAAQYLYLATLGFAWRVPGGVVFGLCALIAIWYATLLAPGREPGLAGLTGGGQRASIGWEARMFIAGASAIVGLATIAYLAITVYLGALVCRRALAGTLSFVAGIRR